MNEHGYSRSLKTRFKKAGLFSWKINDSYAGGVTDFFLEGDQADAWVEVKYIKQLPKRDTTIIDLMNPRTYLSILQQAWLRRRYTKRKDAYVLVGCPEGSILFTELEWETAQPADFYRRNVRSHDEVVAHLLTKVM